MEGKDHLAFEDKNFMSDDLIFLLLGPGLPDGFDQIEEVLAQMAAGHHT